MTKKNSSPGPFARLSRRERQIMDIVYAKGSATSQEVLDALADPPSYSAVRALMKILVGKGLLKHERVGLKFVFRPAVDASKVRKGALTRLMHSLFDNSPVAVVAALLDSNDLKISADELGQLKTLIAEKEAQAKRAKP
ncbi:MAG TPA: BlaI/MecI/CopY family transcriptional regulator [Chthoniobacteraceae bacterium]|nr:BlaI/MecI/CopY family transcriptional regulator [Chthoniobacteraceae bacterium]